MRGLLFLSLMPLVAHAEPVAGLQPMAFLAGSCWKGTFPDGKVTDEHCFDWLYDGKFLRDRHVVRAPGQPDYVGESTYFWDPETRRIEYIYLENLGAISRGTAEPAPDGLIFPAARYVDGDKGMTYRARWTRIDATTYEAHNEIQGKDGWATMFKLKLAKVAPKG